MRQQKTCAFITVVIPIIFRLFPPPPAKDRSPVETLQIPIYMGRERSLESQARLSLLKTLEFVTYADATDVSPQGVTYVSSGDAVEARPNISKQYLNGVKLTTACNGYLFCVVCAVVMHKSLPMLVHV